MADEDVRRIPEVRIAATATSESDPTRRRRSLRQPLTINAVVIAVGGLIFAWKLVRHDIIPKRWRTVEEGYIYRSGKLSVGLVERMWQKHGIEVVVCLDKDDADEIEDIAAARVSTALSIERTIYSLSGDGTGDLDTYVGALTKIVQTRREGRRQVVHCASGVYRTGGVIACYRMLFQGWSREAAYEEMKAGGVKDRDETPLYDFLDENLPEIRRRLIETGVPNPDALAQELPQSLN